MTVSATLMISSTGRSALARVLTDGRRARGLVDADRANPSRRPPRGRSCGSSGRRRAFPHPDTCRARCRRLQFLGRAPAAPPQDRVHVHRASLVGATVAPTYPAPARGDRQDRPSFRSPSRAEGSPGERRQESRQAYAAGIESAGLWGSRSAHDADARTRFHQQLPSASPPLEGPIRPRPNCHPFVSDGRIMAHNGGFEELDRLEAQLGDYLDGVEGDTDSERYLALVTQCIDRNGGDVGAGDHGGRELAGRQRAALLAESRARDQHRPVGAALPRSLQPLRAPPAARRPRRRCGPRREQRHAPACRRLTLPSGRLLSLPRNGWTRAPIGGSWSPANSCTSHLI